MNDNLKRLNEYDRHIKQDIDEPKTRYDKTDWLEHDIKPGQRREYALTERGWVHIDDLVDFADVHYDGFASGDEILRGEYDE